MMSQRLTPKNTDTWYVNQANPDSFHLPTTSLPQEVLSSDVAFWSSKLLGLFLEKWPEGHSGLTLVGRWGMRAAAAAGAAGNGNIPEGT